MTPILPSNLPRATRWAALGLMVLMVSCGGLKTHRDGEGPVVSFDDPEGFSRMAIDPQPGVDIWSFGMPLCLENAGSAASLQEVTPTETVGSAPVLVGAVIHEYDPSTGESGLISIDGYPPATAGSLLPLDGYVLDADCTRGQDRAVELVVGLRKTGDDGGGWLGAALSYRIGDRDYVVQIRNEMLICGESVIAYCESPPPSGSLRATFSAATHAHL